MEPVTISILIVLGLAVVSGSIGYGGLRNQVNSNTENIDVVKKSADRKISDMDSKLTEIQKLLYELIGQVKMLIDRDKSC